jgi:hypothetical protein
MVPEGLADVNPNALARRRLSHRCAHRDAGCRLRYTDGMKPADLRAYAGRAWRVAETFKQDHWARETVERGPLATFEASQMLWQHMRALRPDWPSDDDRRQDLADHIALKQLIDRAAGAFLDAANR